MTSSTQEQQQLAKSNRRTQAERTKTMRNKLLKATIQSLADNGYAGTTVGKIAQYAGTSNGTPLHHFANKAAIIEAAAEYLIKSVSANTAAILDESSDTDTSFKSGGVTAWKQMINTPHNAAIIEILLASKRDEQLRGTVGQLILKMGFDLVEKSQRWFESTDDRYELRDLMTILQWVIRGMSLDAHLGKSPQLFDHYIEVILDLFANFLTKRKDKESLNLRPKNK